MSASRPCKLRKDRLTGIGHDAMVFVVAFPITILSCKVKGGGGRLAAVQSSAFEKADTSATYIPCSTFDKGVMNFHLRYQNWFPNWQLKN